MAQVDVLVGYATVFGSTAGIAARIGQRLVGSGLTTAVHAIDDLSGMVECPASAVVLGSAVHNRRWLPGASAFVRDHAGVLAHRPVWLFSVSSVGDVGSFLAPPVARVMRRARGESKDIAELRTLVDVRDHRNFAGAIERGHWSTAGHVFFRLVGGTYGDHRHWDDVDRWTDRIAAARSPNGA
jgi:menaquinone-dependent protoporphyrinogen oxidase